jgi:hypothetical protein
VAECTCPEVSERPWEPPRKVLSVFCPVHEEVARENAARIAEEFKARQQRGRRRG